MSEQEKFDSQEVRCGVDPAVGGSDRTVVNTYRYDREGNAISHKVSFRSIPLPQVDQASFPLNLSAQQILDRLHELASRFKARLSPESEQRINDAVQEGIDRQMSAGYVVPRIRQIPPVDTGRMRRSIAPNENYYFTDEEVAQVRGYNEIQRLMRDRMIQSSGLPAEVLFDDAPGRQYPPQFVEEMVADSEDRLRERMQRSNLYGYGPQTRFPQYVIREPAQDRQQEKRSQPIACQDCKHYDGNTYGGNQLICGMHPYGPEADSCSDREVWQVEEWREALLSEQWRNVLDFSDRQLGLWIERLKELTLLRHRTNRLVCDQEFVLMCRIKSGLMGRGMTSAGIVQLERMLHEFQAGNRNLGN